MINGLHKKDWEDPSDFGEEIVGSILDDLRQDGTTGEGLAAGYHGMNDVSLPNSFIENGVRIFNAAVEAARQAVMAEARARHCCRMLGQTLERMNGDAPEDDLESSREWVKSELYERYRDLKNRAWAGILRSTQVTSRLSSSAQRRLEAEFENIKIARINGLEHLRISPGHHRKAGRNPNRHGL